MILMRILAQLVDLFLALFLFVFSYLVILPALSSAIPAVSVVALAVVILIIAIGLIALVQYPFLRVNQTVGKAFFGLEIVSTNSDRPLDMGILLQRELFGKLFSCYLICIPALFGKEGGHDKAAETKVVRRMRKAAR